jgi:hypothetical protein
VTAVDSDDTTASFTNYGTDCSDVAAPGENILSTFYLDLTSTYFTEPYGWLSGTSMATPVVSGVAALLLAVDNSLDPDTLTDLLVDSADPVADATIGSGRVNATTAIDALLNSGPDPVALSAYHTEQRTTEVSAEKRTRDSTPVFSWPEPDSVEDITGYYVYFGKERFDPVTSGTLQTERKFTPQPIHGNETTYRLRVRSVDSAGTTSALTQFLYLIDTKVKRPTWRDVTETDEGVRLRWYKPKQEHVLGYYIYRASKKTEQFQKVSSRIINQRGSSGNYTDTTAKAGHAYYYKVRSVDDLGNVSTLSEPKRIVL